MKFSTVYRSNHLSPSNFTILFITFWSVNHITGEFYATTMVKSEFHRFSHKDCQFYLFLIPQVTEELIRKKSEHNELLIFSLEELSLHQENIEKIEHVHDWCRELKILLMQSNLISKIGNNSISPSLSLYNLLQYTFCAHLMQKISIN